MAKIAGVQEVTIADLRPYENNAKKHGHEQIDRIKASIQEFGFLTPCLIDKEKRIIAGHGRVMAAQELGMKTVPCVFIEGLTETQRKAYILADNRLTELGDWDMSIVFDELRDLDADNFVVELTGFDMPGRTSDWFENRERFDQSREEGNDEYNEFLDKFENPKTTDDCYTPDNVYEIIAQYVENRYGKDRRDFVRPFYPGGDYQGEKYKPTDVVVDNPPFSILAEIVDFYAEREQPFFLFAPGLATLTYITRKNVTAICTYASVTYENGASVSTSFLTNLEGNDVAAMTSFELSMKIEEANEENLRKLHKQMPKYEYPYQVLTAAKMGWLSKYGQNLIIKKSDSVLIRALDAQKEADKGIYGSALLLSEKAAAERAAAERAAAERAAATVWPLSDREMAIVKSLGGES